MRAEKIKYYEAMRIIAMVLVVFNHLPGYTLYMRTTGVEQWLCMMITMFTRVNVPLFFMVSGALLLGKDEKYTVILKKRISRFLTVILIFNVGLFFLRTIKGIVKNTGYDSSPASLITGIFSGKLEVTYWFLYAYLAFLLMLPLLQKIAKRLDKQDFWALIILHFIFISVPKFLDPLFGLLFGQSFEISSNLTVPLAATNAFFYPLIGYYLDRCIDVLSFSKKKLGQIWLVAILGILISCFMTFSEGVYTGEYSQRYVQMFDYLTTIAVFITIKRYYLIKDRGNGKIDLNLIGSLTFGIYLFDPFIKEIFVNPYFRVLEGRLPIMIGSVGWIIISFVVGGTITYLAKKIPLFAKLL